MLADPLTRGMTLKVFHEHNAHMGVIPDSILVEWESYLCSISYGLQIFCCLDFLQK